MLGWKPLKCNLIISPKISRTKLDCCQKIQQKTGCEAAHPGHPPPTALQGDKSNDQLHLG